MSLLVKCGLAVFAVLGLALAVFVKMQKPSSRKKRKINTAMKSIRTAARDIASMVK